MHEGSCTEVLYIIYVGLSRWLSVKNPPAMQETQEIWVQSLGQEDPLVEDMATHSVVLPGKSHGQRGMATTVLVYVCARIHTHVSYRKRRLCLK